MRMMTPRWLTVVIVSVLVLLHVVIAQEPEGPPSYCPSAHDPIFPTNYTQIVLEESDVLQYETSQHCYTYFNFNQSGPGVLSITVTRFSGDPDLFVSFNTVDEILWPTSTDYDLVSDLSNIEAVDYYINDTTDYHFYIAVRGYTDTNYSIVVSFAEAGDGFHLINLDTGIPQAGFVSADAWIYYVYVCPDGVDDLVVTLTVLAGEPYFFINRIGINDNITRDNLPTELESTWESSISDNPSIRIDSPMAGKYLIGVEGWEASNYRILVVASGTGQNATLLLENMPILNQLRTNAFSQYYFDIGSRNNGTVTVAVTSFDGNPSLYVDLDQTAGVNSTWQSHNSVAEFVTIPLADLTSSRFYVNIRADTDCIYQVLWYANPIDGADATVIHLQNGQSQQDYVTSSMDKYYSIELYGKQEYNLVISLTTLTGPTPRLLVSKTGIPAASDPSTFQWQDYDIDGAPAILINPTDNQYCNESVCMYYIAAHSISASIANYSVLAFTTNSTAIRLTDSIPLRSIVPHGHYDYFIFTLNDNNAALLFSLTPVNGHPDVYISMTPKPSRHNNTWSSTSVGGDSIYIANATSGTYYVAVHGSASLCEYTLLVNSLHVNSSRISPLLNGVPQIGYVERVNDTDARPLYYIFEAPGNSSITITMNPRYGNPDLYAIQYKDDMGIISSLPADRLPGPLYNGSDPQWSAQEFGSDTLTFDLTSLSCQFCRLLICVYPVTSSLYSIAATTGDYSMRLQLGVPVSGVVGSDSYTYYHFSLLNDTNVLIISLDALSGDPDLFVKNSSNAVLRPTRHDFNWSSESFGSDALFFTDGTLMYAGVYSIGVYGFRNASYSLVATTDFILLSLSRSRLDTLKMNQIGMYAFWNDESSSQEAALSFLVSTPQLINMYVSTSSRVNYTTCTSFPTQDDNSTCWTTLTSTTAPNNITIPYNSLRPHRNYYLDVQAVEDCSFEVTVSYLVPQINPTLIPLGTSIDRMTSDNMYGFYMIQLNDLSEDLHIDATLYYGNIEILVSNDRTNPAPRNGSSIIARAASDNSQSHSVHLTIPINQTSATTYFISVWGHANTHYVLIATSGTSSMLSFNRPRNAVANANGNVFAISSLSYSSISFILQDASNINGNRINNATFAIFVCWNSPFCNSTQPPNQNNANITRTAALFDPFIIDNILTSSMIFVTVQCLVTDLRGVSFIIIARSPRDPSIIFTDDEPRTGSIATVGNSVYYEVDVNEAHTVTVLLDICVGNGNLFIDTQNQAPSESAAEWQADGERNTLQVILPPGSSNTSAYYLGVKSTDVDNSSFIYSLEIDTEHSQYIPLSGPGFQLTQVPLQDGMNIEFNNIYWPASDVIVSYFGIVAFVNATGNMGSYCGMEYLLDHAGVVIPPLQDSRRRVGILQLRNLTNGQSYRANVVVEAYRIYDSLLVGRRVYSSTQFVATTIIPNNTNTDPNNGNGLSASAVAAITVPLVLLCLAVIIYLYTRNRVMKRELGMGIEMNGVPSSKLRKAMAGAPSMRLGRAMNASGNKSFDPLVVGSSAFSDEFTEDQLDLQYDNDSGDLHPNEYALNDIAEQTYDEDQAAYASFK